MGQMIYGYRNIKIHMVILLGQLIENCKVYHEIRLFHKFRDVKALLLTQHFFLQRFIK